MNQNWFRRPIIIDDLGEFVHVYAAALALCCDWKWDSNRIVDKQKCVALGAGPYTSETHPKSSDRENKCVKSVDVATATIDFFFAAPVAMWYAPLVHVHEGITTENSSTE